MARKLRTMDDLPLDGKRVLVRVDFNVSMSEAGRVGETEEPTVSSDFIGDPHSAIVALDMTRVVGGNLVKVMGWYDNEWAYSNRLIEQVVGLAGN